MLGRAIGEFGRIYKTQYLLTYLDDLDYRRRILTQLNRGESRDSLARTIFYGKRGELHQSYREGQEDQLGALGLVVNAVVIRNTKYKELALDAIKQTGEMVLEHQMFNGCHLSDMNTSTLWADIHLCFRKRLRTAD